MCDKCPDFFCFPGGERSFSTLAFILALGERAESPFRAMDEYDVFMDAITRRIATQTLLQNAMEQDGMQLLLLTPQVCTELRTNVNSCRLGLCMMWAYQCSDDGQARSLRLIRVLKGVRHREYMCS